MIYVHMRPEVTKYDTTMTTTINKLVLGDDMKTVVWWGGLVLVCEVNTFFPTGDGGQQARWKEGEL